MPLPHDNMLFGFASKLTDEQREYVDSIVVTLTKNFRGRLAQKADELTW